MRKNKFNNIKKGLLLAISCSAVLIMASCSELFNTIDKTTVDSAYGSLTTENASRAVDTSIIKNALVEVTGTGIATALSAEGSITTGSGNFTIEEIPVGENRIVTVYAKDSANISLAGYVMRGVTDIVSGNNSVTVDWTTTAYANVLYTLNADGTDISALTDAQEASISAAIDSSTHATLIDTDAIAAAFENGSLSAASNYVLAGGSVTFIAGNDVVGATATVNDPASASTTVIANNNTLTGVTPGTWILTLIEDSTTLYTTSVTVINNSTVSAGTAGIIEESVIIYAKADSAPELWAWTDSANLVGGDWNTKPTMTSATGYMNDATGWYMYDVTDAYGDSSEPIKFILVTNGTQSDDIVSTKTATFWYDNGTYYDTDPTASDNPGDPTDSVKIYVEADTAPSIWAWQPSGVACTTLMGYSWTSQPTMTSATDLNWNDGWYVLEIGADYYTADESFTFILNSGSNITTTKTSTFWYDNGTYYDSDPTTVPEPVSPTITVGPANNSDISLEGSIIIALDNGNDTITNASVSVSGDNSKNYTYSDFTSDKLTVPVFDITTIAGTTISVTISVTNSVSTETTSVSYTSSDIAVDNFTWDNVLSYFVLTDRFNDGNSSNNNSYGRVSSGIPTVATFHGGDIKGLTDKIDYLDALGVNAIWVTAPYEQMHGWTSGKDELFPHYAFHGYYTQDWSMMDKNMGTVDEFREFVTAAHEHGIRIVMDVVMNHTGYDNWQDSIDYNFGGFYDDSSKYNQACFDTDGLYKKGDGASWGTNWSDNNWAYWWSSWARGFDGKFGFETPGGDDLTMSLAGLPDIVTEKTDSDSIPTFLQTKWGVEGENGSSASSYSDWRVASADGEREDRSWAPVVYIEHWIAAWVEEFGIDGFRCDTAKHIDRYRWGELKDICSTSLQTWRASDRADSYAKNWDEDFWMTGECFGWANSVTGDYYSTGGFDSMINFALNGTQWSGSGSSGSVPTVDTWSQYSSLINANPSDSDNNGNNNNMLTYVSSHDTGLCRPSDNKNLGTMLCLLPGGVQIFYGDETSRPAVSNYYGDSDMATRGDMNWDYDTDTYDHWCKVGTFRKNHPAVGAGVQSDLSDNTYARTYSGSAGDDTVVIKLGTGSVNVTGFFADGTQVTNAYDGETTTVSNGTASFSSSASPILVETTN